MHLPCWRGWQRMRENKYHKPVLVEEVLSGLQVGKNALLNKQGWYIDATLGTGGHTISLIGKGVKVLGIELDEQTLAIAEKRIKGLNIEGNAPLVIHGNFIDLDRIVG